jgi:hypothetical protein
MSSNPVKTKKEIFLDRIFHFIENRETKKNVNKTDTAASFGPYRPSFSSLAIDLLFQVPTRLPCRSLFSLSNSLQKHFSVFIPPNLSIPRPARPVLFLPLRFIETVANNIDI